MLLLQGRTTRGSRVSLFGVALVGLGLLILLSGIALLMVVAVAGAALGAAVMAYRRLTGRPPTRPLSPRERVPLEVEADYEILPPMHDRPGEDRGDRNG